MKETKSATEPKQLPGIGELPLEDLGDQIEAWKKKHGEIHQISIRISGDREFNGVFRTPKESDFTSATRKEISGPESSREICRRTVLYPDVLSFNELAQQEWAMCIPISEQLIEIANVTTKAKVKKL